MADLNGFQYCIKHQLPCSLAACPVTLMQSFEIHKTDASFQYAGRRTNKTKEVV